GGGRPSDHRRQPPPVAGKFGSHHRGPPHRCRRSGVDRPLTSGHPTT
ncbi:hypothetical protein A2U01_0074628, partial [Trifolium medium]|nr:hypothetical protein [Trifolium medium]